jgi:hypothetical protein
MTAWLLNAPLEKRQGNSMRGRRAAGQRRRETGLLPPMTLLELESAAARARIVALGAGKDRPPPGFFRRQNLHHLVGGAAAPHQPDDDLHGVIDVVEEVFEARTEII